MVATISWAMQRIRVVRAAYPGTGSAKTGKSGNISGDKELSFEREQKTRERTSSFWRYL
jgi:hypothetical protein